MGSAPTSQVQGVEAQRRRVRGGAVATVAAGVGGAEDLPCSSIVNKGLNLDVVRALPEVTPLGKCQGQVGLAPKPGVVTSCPFTGSCMTSAVSPA